MAGQTDRFGQPIPAAPGYGTILNPDGSQPQMRNILRLGTGFTAVDDPNSEATSLTVDISIAGSVQQVNAATNLRNDLFLFGPDPNKIYVTKYYVTPTDTGGMSYRWNASDTTTDDGVLHIKNSYHSTGRFQPIKPTDGKIDAQACGPALADVGSITRSFDPTGTRSIGTELLRISTILRNSGWAGIRFGSDVSGNSRYKIDGSEEIGRSLLPFIPFTVESVSGATFFGDPSGMVLSRPLGVYTYGNGGSILATGAYTSANWHQTINGGENVFAAVADITGISVGDTMLVRIGAEKTDASGVCGSYFFATVMTVTPGAGTTGTIATWESCPEPALGGPGINVFRTQDHHDMVKITGFQDGTVFDGITFENVFIAFQYYRNCKVDCIWSKSLGFALNGLGGIGLDVPRMHVRQASGSLSVAGNLITLASQYNTHIGSLIINDMRPIDNPSFNVLTEESGCRNTRIDTCDVTYNSGTTYGGAVIFAGQTPGQTDQIVIGNLTVRGGYAGFILGLQCYVDVLDDKCGISHYIFIRPDQAKSIIYFGQLYRNELSNDFSFPISQSVAVKTFAFPAHGLTSNLRIKPTSLTGITAASVSGDAGVTNIDVLSDLTSGQWCDVNQAAVMGIAGANYYGTSLTLKITTDGTTPAGNALYIKHSCYEKDLIFTDASADTSIPLQIVTNGAPTSNADFLSQECFDSTNSVWYKSVAVGTGSSDWKPSSAGGAIQAGTAALGSLVFTHASPPTTPASGKTAVWCDSTNHIFNAKDASGNVSTTVGASNAIASQWVTGLNTFGSLLRAQPSSVDLSDIAPVALTNANATITVGGGSYYSLAAATLSTLRTLTLGAAGANDKQSIQVRVYAQGSNYLVNDSAATLLWTVTTGNKAVGNFVWNTGTGKFQLQSWNFFT